MAVPGKGWVHVLFGLQCCADLSIMLDVEMQLAPI